VGINTSYGPIVQCEIVGALLREKAKELEVPLIMSAEEQSLATGLHLLMYGDHIICNPSTMLGNLGFTMNVSHFKQFAEEWNFHVKFITKGANKMRLNKFEPIR